MQIDNDIGGAAFAAIVRGSLDAIIVSDEQGRVIEFNPAAERIFGWSRAEALRRPIVDLIIPQHLKARHEAGMERMRAGAPPRLTERRVEVQALRKNGEIFDCELSVARLDVVGQPLFAACLRDLSEQIRERTARREVEDLLRAILEDQTEVIFRYDADLIVTSCNGAAAELWGVDREELLGRHLLEHVEPDRKEQLTADFAALTLEAPVRYGTDRASLPDGRTRVIEWTDRALFDEHGTLIGYQSVGRDMTERMQERQALASSEARIAAFLKNAPIGMYVKDSEGRFAIANAEMEKVFGRPIEEILGKSAREIAPPELLPIIEAADAEIRRTGRPHSVEEHIPGAESYEWTLVVRFPIPQSDGQPMEIGGFDIDISSVKAAEAELVRAREALHRSEKMTALGSFAASLAHELNNPLTVLAGQAEMLREDVGEGAAADRAERIMRAANRCSRIARSFLAMAQRKPPRRVPADLNSIVSSALELAAFMFRGSDVEVETHLSESPPLLIADPDQLHQVVLNLLLNAEQAMRHSPEKRITVTTGIDSATRTARLEVADTGPGLSETVRDRAFDAFFSTKTATGGVGIGLFHCQQVALDHGGEIDLLPSTGGAHFRLVLPVEVSGDRAEHSPPTLTTATPLRTLVLDDDPDVAAAICEMLRAMGCEAIASTRAPFVAHLQASQNLDVVLMDLTPADIASLSTSGQLPNVHHDLAEHIVFMTGAALDANLERALDAAGCPFLQKPFGRGELLSLLAGLFSRRPTAGH
ncbi:MAG: PAS domain S-box protein [Pseudomonadota bacterium]